MAHKKAGGTAKNLTDSNPKYLGIKVADGDKVRIGGIIVRQRGTKILPHIGVRIGKDHTIYASQDGTVKFDSARKRNFDSTTKRLRRVSVV